MTPQQLQSAAADGQLWPLVAAMCDGSVRVMKGSWRSLRQPLATS